MACLRLDGPATIFPPDDSHSWHPGTPHMRRVLPCIVRFTSSRDRLASQGMRRESCAVFPANDDFGWPLSTGWGQVLKHIAPSDFSRQMAELLLCATFYRHRRPRCLTDADGAISFAATGLACWSFRWWSATSAVCVLLVDLDPLCGRSVRCLRSAAAGLVAQRTVCLSHRVRTVSDWQSHVRACAEHGHSVGSGAALLILGIALIRA